MLPACATPLRGLSEFQTIINVSARPWQRDLRTGRVVGGCTCAARRLFLALHCSPPTSPPLGPPSSTQIVKATVGAGSFVLPFCMLQMGLIPGIATIVLLGGVCVYTTLMLVRTKNMLYKETGRRDITYVDIGTNRKRAARSL